MTPIESYNQELYHYGVKGMKWGVKKKHISEKKVERAAKKLANLKAKEMTARDRFIRDVNDSQAMYFLDDSSHDKVTRMVDKSREKYKNAQKKFTAEFEKVSKKLADTPYSDIKVSDGEHKYRSGRAYVQTLIGRVGDSPYDGSARYKVTAGTWSK